MLTAHMQRNMHKIPNERAHKIPTRHKCAPPPSPQMESLNANIDVSQTPDHPLSSVEEIDGGRPVGDQITLQAQSFQ